MLWFDAGTKKMSVPSFGNFTKLIKVQCTGTWVSPRRRAPTQSRQLPVPYFRWRSMTLAHASDHVGRKQRLGALAGGDDSGGPVQQSSSQPAALGAPPYRPTHGPTDPIGSVLEATHVSFRFHVSYCRTRSDTRFGPRVPEASPATPPDGLVGAALRAPSASPGTCRSAIMDGRS